jgi:hypothetical protein
MVDRLHAGLCRSRERNRVLPGCLTQQTKFAAAAHPVNFEEHLSPTEGRAFEYELIEITHLVLSHDAKDSFPEIILV